MLAFSKILEFCTLLLFLLTWYGGLGNKFRKEGTTMVRTYEEEIEILRENTCDILHELRFGVHRLGYKQLLVLIPYYALDSGQSLSKELYPYVAERFGHVSWKSVEHEVRVAILDAWKHRDSNIWEKYFPGAKKVPSNKQFMATIAERIKKAPPG